MVQSTRPRQSLPLLANRNRNRKRRKPSMAETESPVIAEIEHVSKPDALESVGEAPAPVAIVEPSEPIASTVNDEKPETKEDSPTSAPTTVSIIPFEIRDEEANASFLLGKRDALLNNYQSACDHLSKACERIVKLRECDTSPELAEPYFYYGQALLYLGLSEQQVFGSDVIKDEQNDENEHDVIEEEEEVEGDDAEEKEGNEGEDSIPDDDHVNDLERAFEILECAHMIYSKALESTPSDAHILTRVADIHVMLGDICNENGDHENALSHVLKAIDLQESIPEQQRYRLFAESYYKLGLIYELINKFSEAVDSFDKAMKAIQQAIEQLQGDDQTAEREELQALLPAMELKRNDAQASIADRHLIAQARKILVGTNNTTDNSTTEAPAKEITLTVRHKRPVADVENDEEATKKAKIE